MATNKKKAKAVTKKPAAKKPAPKKISKPVKKAAVKAAKKPAVKQVKRQVKPAKPAAKKKSTPAKKSVPLKKLVKQTPKSNKKLAPKKSIPVKKAGKPASKPKAVVSKPVHKKTAAKKPAPKKAEIRKPESKKPILKSLPKAKDIKVPPPKPVVLPKITATKARKYEPEFTKSVLDQAPYENIGPTMRYSDGELNEFRELIQRKLETAKKELTYLQGLITRKDEMGGDDTDNRYMTMEDGSLSMEREQLSQMASRQITFIDHLEKAMMRIENKTYGICRVTGKLIDKARLRAVPHATLSIEAKMGIVK